MFRIRIPLISATRIRIRLAKSQPNSWKISFKNSQKSQEHHIFFWKILNFCTTEINIFLVNNRTNHFLEKNIFLINKKVIIDLRLDPDWSFHKSAPKHCNKRNSKEHNVCLVIAAYHLPVGDLLAQAVRRLVRVHGHIKHLQIMP